jgi:H/ACA ribonucleoprotein complex subunit 2
MSDDEQPKKKKARTSEGGDEKGEKSYEDRVKAINVISSPLASKKSTKRIHKLVRKASSAKHVRRGVKELDKGLAIIAGDIFPIDVISHLPVMLEENGIPYLFVPSKQELGAAASTKRPTSCVLVKTPKKGFEAMDIYDGLVKEAKEYDPSN